MRRFMKYGIRNVTLKAVFAAFFLNGAVFAEPAQILMIGDSLTHGYGLPAEQGFVPQLEAWLQENGHDVALINGGVSGDTTAGGAARIGWLLTPEVDAVVIELGANDALRGIDPSHIAENLRKMVDISFEAGLRVLLIRVPSVGNFGTDYQSEYDAAFLKLAERANVDLVDNFFAALSKKTAVELNDVMQSDGIHPNSAGVGLIVNDLGPVIATFLCQESD